MTTTTFIVKREKAYPYCVGQAETLADFIKGIRSGEGQHFLEYYDRENAIASAAHQFGCNTPVYHETNEEMELALIEESLPCDPTFIVDDGADHYVVTANDKEDALTKYHDLMPVSETIEGAKTYAKNILGCSDPEIVYVHPDRDEKPEEPKTLVEEVKFRIGKVAVLKRQDLLNDLAPVMADIMSDRLQNALEDVDKIVTGEGLGGPTRQAWNQDVAAMNECIIYDMDDNKLANTWADIFSELFFDKHPDIETVFFETDNGNRPVKMFLADTNEQIVKID